MAGSVGGGRQRHAEGVLPHYQGWGGFTGNLLLGLFFGWIFLRWRRVWPLIVAHFAIDSMAGLAYMAFRGHCVGVVHPLTHLAGWTPPGDTNRRARRPGR